MSSSPIPTAASKGLSGRPLVFGEVLFDRFPDGNNVLGGAPFNVCWHLRGFGLDPLLITAIGSDEPGREVLACMPEWGLSTQGVQIDRRHPTGRVMVHTTGNENRFEIGTDQAWDYIETGPALEAARGELALLYHGTLALRADRSWRSLETMLLRDDAPPTFVDLNLRDPWWTQDRVRWCLSTAYWLKLNEHELAIVSSRDTTDAESCRSAARHLADTYEIPRISVTRGSADALLIVDGDSTIWASPPPVEDVADTVGAGDAFSAVACLGLLEGWAPRITLERATRFAADLCRIRGATTAEASLYERHRRDWARAREAIETGSSPGP